MIPFSANYRLLVFGEKTKGVVTEQKKALENSETVYCIIHFEVKGNHINFIGPENLKYPPGKEVTIFYDKRNPRKFIMFNFAGLVLNNKMIAPGVLLIMWFAFYLAMQETRPTSKAQSIIYRYKKALEQNKRGFKRE